VFSIFYYIRYHYQVVALHSLHPMLHLMFRYETTEKRHGVLPFFFSWISRIKQERFVERSYCYQVLKSHQNRIGDDGEISNVCRTPYSSCTTRKWKHDLFRRDGAICQTNDRCSCDEFCRHCFLFTHHTSLHRHRSSHFALIIVAPTWMMCSLLLLPLVLHSRATIEPVSSRRYAT